MRRIIAVLAAAVGTALVLTTPAWADCSFTLDREYTHAGEEFYGIGSSYTTDQVSQEVVEIHWKSPDGPLLARTVVTDGKFRQRLVTPADAKPGLYIVYAVSLSKSGRPDYALYHGITVLAPGESPPAPGTAAAPPASPPGVHEPVPAARPYPQPAGAEAPVHAVVHAPAAVPVPAAQAEQATSRVPWWERSAASANAPAAAPAADRPALPVAASPAGPSGLVGALAGAQAQAGLPALAMAVAAAAAVLARRRPDPSSG